MLFNCFLYSNLSKTNERLAREKLELEAEVKHFRSGNEKLQEVSRLHDILPRVKRETVSINLSLVYIIYLRAITFPIHPTFASKFAVETTVVRAKFYPK